MHLIRFFFYGCFIALIIGEFGRYPFGTSGGVQLMDVMVLLTLLLFLIWKVINKEKIVLPFVWKWLWPFYGVGLLSLLISVSFFPVMDVVKGVLYLLRFFLYSSILLIVPSVPNPKKILITTGVAVALLGFLQFLFFPNFEFLTQFGFDPHQYRLTSTFLDPNFVGIFLVIILSLTFEKKMWGTSAIIAVAILLTYSRSTYLFLGILLLGWGMTTSKKFLLIFLTCVVLGLFIPRVSERIMGGFTVDSSAVERFESWQDGWRVFQNYPLIGVGLGNYRVAQEQLNLFKVYSPEGGHAGGGVDSSLLFVLASTGVIGLGCYLWFWFQVFRKKKNLRIIIIGLFIASQFVNALFFPPIMLLYFTLIGMKDE